jgi:hypothetical protein
MSKIFLSYRRDDSRWAAGRLYDRLSAEFGPDDVFMDTRRIGPGTIFTDEIAKALESSQVLIVLIGGRWLAITDDAGKRRLDDPNDLVAFEVANALGRGIRVIPLLVDGAKMPRPDDLPAPLARLSLCNALEISENRFPQDVQALIDALKDDLRAISGTCRTSSPVDDLLEAYQKSFVGRQEEKRTQYAKDPQRNLLDFYIEAWGATAEPPRHSEGAESRELWELVQPSLKQAAPCFVLADFGQGKTWMMDMMQYRLASAADRPWIPLSLSLRGLRFDSLDKSRPIFDELRDRAWAAAIGESAASACRPVLVDYFEKNRFLFLFDAVDEMAVSTKQDREQLLDGIGALRGAARRSPVLLTCRRSYFYDASQERSLPGRGYDVFYLWPWSRDNILAYLRRVHALGLLDDEPEKILGQIEKTYSLKDLSSRAMLAAMLVGQWKELMGGASADLPSLYERHIEKAILDWQAPKSWQLERHEIRRAMEEIAFLMFRLDSLAITPEDLDEYFAGKFAEFQVGRFSKIAESFVRDIRTNSFLLREGSQYVFCHVSIWEFLVARKLARSMEAADLAAFQVQDRAWQYKSIIRNFLVPMLRKENKLAQIAVLLGSGPSL